VIASLAGRWAVRPDEGGDRRVEALAARTGGSMVSAGPFLVTGGPATAASRGGCMALIAGRISEIVGADGADPARWLSANYERVGAAALNALRGEFVAVLWDPRRREGVVARDQLGGRSLYYRAVPGGVAFAEETRDLLPLLAVTPGPDRRTVVSLAARGTMPIGGSVFEGVHRLPPGQLLRFADERWTAESWWRPRYHGVREGSSTELSERVVASMDRSVRRCVEQEGVGVMLSGGLDSTTVAASAAQQAVGATARPVGYSGVFPGRRAVDEAQLIDDVTTFLGIRSVRRVITGGSALAGAHGYLRCWGVPPASPNTFLWRALLARARADGMRVMLDGEGGDEVFGVTMSLLADRLRQGRALGAWRLARRITGVGPQARMRRVAGTVVRFGVQPALPPGPQRLLSRALGTAPRAPAWLAARDAADFLADSTERFFGVGDGPMWWRDQAVMLTATRERLDAQGYLRRRTAEVGLQARHPFMNDVDLVETVLSLPPDPRFDPDHDRVLLRRGLAGRLPDSVRLRQGKSHFTSLLYEAVTGDDGPLVHELLADPAAEIRRYVRPESLDADVLRAGPDGYAGGRIGWLLTMWRLASVELWLRAQNDPSWLEAFAQRLPTTPPSRFEVVA